MARTILKQYRMSGYAFMNFHQSDKRIELWKRGKTNNVISLSAIMTGWLASFPRERDDYIVDMPAAKVHVVFLQFFLMLSCSMIVQATLFKNRLAAFCSKRNL